MPALSALTIATLVTQIKTEARIKGADNLDQFVRDLIHELLLEELTRHRYHEMLVLNHDIVMVDEVGLYELPEDHMFTRHIRYVTTSGCARTLHPKTDYITPTDRGTPRYYETSGTSLSVFPYLSVRTNDALRIDYYKMPDSLEDADVFPIPRILAPLKQKAVVRVHLFNNELQVAGALAGNSSTTIAQAQLGTD